MATLAAASTLAASLPSSSSSSSSSSSDPAAFDADAAEEKHRQEVVASMRHYYAFFHKAIVGRLERHFKALTPEQLALLPKGALEQRSGAYEAALRANQRFFDQVLLHMGQTPSILTTEYDPASVVPPAYAYLSWMVPDHHASKLSGILHAVARDWGAECANERTAIYGPIMEAVEEALPIGSRVLVPGSGLSRLACEVAGAGMASQGNDFDLFMLFTSSFILNGSSSSDGSTTDTVTIHPWVHGLNNRLSHADAVRPVPVPDVAPIDILEGLVSDTPAIEKGGEEDDTAGAGAGAADTAAAAAAAQKKREELAAGRDFSMCAGDFMQCYGAPEDAGSFDGFVSCFFIDTAPNIFAYIALIWRILKPGGVWVNLGPLQWHWSDEHSEFAYTNNTPIDPRYHESIELSWEELRHAIQQQGFVLEKSRVGIPCTYTRDHRSMHKTAYEAIFFKAKKPSSFVTSTSKERYTCVECSPPE